MRRRGKSGDRWADRGKKLNVINMSPTAPYHGGAAMRLEADREKAGASDLCEGRKL